MKHEKIRDLLSAYLDDELSLPDKAAVDTHLHDCRECRDELGQLRKLDSLTRQVTHPPQKEEYWEALPGMIHSGITERLQAGPPKERKMFKDAFITGDSNVKLKAFVFPFSMTVHAVIILMMLVFPLMNTGDLPEVEIYSAFLAPTPPPPPPPPPPAKKRTRSKRTTRIKPVQARVTIQPGQLVAPVEIPDEIAEEELSDIGIEGGVVGGVEGGVVGGVLGGVVGGVLGGVVGEVEAPVRAGGEIRAPRLVRRVDPLYPEIARQARVEGVVIIEATTDVYGRVQAVRVLRSIPLLDQTAIDAVRQWVYEPMLINGKPRGVIFTVTVTFKLK